MLDSRVLLSATVATPNGSSEIDLSFSFDDPSANSVQVMRDSTLIYSGAIISSLQDTGLSPATTYSYSESDSNDDGPTGGSTASATTDGLPPANPGVTATSPSASEVDLTITSDSAANAMQILRDGTQVYAGLPIGTFSDTGLTADGVYAYTVNTSNTWGSSSGSAGAATGPFNPGVGASSNGPGEMDLTLSADGTATSMQILRNGSQIYAGGPIGAFADTGLTADTSYSYTVNTSSTYGSSSSSTSGTTAPSAPSVTATPNGSGDIDLTIAADSYATSMQILSNGSQIYSGPIVSTYSDTLLPVDSSYTYTVVTSNSNGASSGTASATTGPSSPSVTATGINGGEIDLAITPDSNTISMEILRDGTQIYTGGVVSTYADTGLAADTSYSYTVNTSTSSGTASGSASASTGLSYPTITATPSSNGTEVDLALTADSNATLMQLFRDSTMIYSGGPVSSFADTGLASDASYSYTVTISNDTSSSSNMTGSGTVPTPAGVSASSPSSTEIDLTITPDFNAPFMQILRDGTQIYYGSVIGTYADTSLDADSSHSYTVTTINGNGSSSGSASTTTAPDNPTVTATGNGTQIDLTIAADPTATSMEILRNGDSIYSGAVLSTYSDTGLPADSSYTYTVNTSNSNGLSSASASATTGPSDPVVSATAVSSSEIDLTIAADSTATSMVITRDGTILYGGPPIGSFADTGLAADTTYGYVVTTSNSNGTSTGTASATTPDDPGPPPPPPTEPTLEVTSTADAQENGVDGSDYGNIEFTLVNADGSQYYSPSGTIVSFAVGGTAVAGVQYAALPTSVTIPASGTFDLPVQALDDEQIDPTLTVTVTPTASSDFTVSGDATCNILDGDTRAITFDAATVSPDESTPIVVSVGGSAPQKAQLSIVPGSYDSNIIHPRLKKDANGVTTLTVKGLRLGETTIQLQDQAGNVSNAVGMSVQPYQVSFSQDSLTVCTAGAGQSLTVTVRDANGEIPSRSLNLNFSDDGSLQTSEDAFADPNPAAGMVSVSTDGQGQATIHVRGAAVPGTESDTLSATVSTTFVTSAGTGFTEITVVPPVITLSPTDITLLPGAPVTITAEVFDPTNDDARIQGVRIGLNIADPTVATSVPYGGTTDTSGDVMFSVAAQTGEGRAPSGTSTTIIAVESADPSDAVSTQIMATIQY